MSFLNIIQKLFGNKQQRDDKKYQPIVDEIKKAGEALPALSNDELRAKINDIRADIAAAIADDEKAIVDLKQEIETMPLDQRQPVWDKVDAHEKAILDTIEEKLNYHLPVVFAVVKETAARFAANPTVEVTATQMDRDLAAAGKDFVSIEGDKAIYKNHWMAAGNEITWDMVHYDVQLYGGVVLFQGKIAEMATGEGKTLVATLPVFLRSLSKRGVHVVTVNDYLSKRDSEWMGPLYMFHGATVDCIDKHQPNTPERRAAYQCDITFGTNNEFGFDYLRDNMAMSPDDLVQRKHYYAIVDEVDSVLIDDARTPLIISGPVPKGDDQYFNEYKGNVVKVVEAQQRLFIRTFDEAKKKIASDKKEDQQEGAMLLYRCYKALPKNRNLIKFLSQEGMRKLLLDAEAKYMANNSELMPEVTDPLYFIIDEKNRSVELTDKGIDELTGTQEDPQFFVLPDVASQLSELEHVENLEERQQRKDEIMQNYAIKSERVHTVNQLLKAYTLFEKEVEYVIIDNKVKIVDEQTGRIMEGRRYSDGLHQAIEAKEGVKVEAATQTFATITLQNFFRMYYKLAGMTGTASTEAEEFWDIYKLEVVTIHTNKPLARVDMNDRIYRTLGEKYDAIINEIQRLHDIGRPVLVGTTSVEISEKLSRMLQMRKIQHNVLNAKLHQREAEIVALAGKPGTVTIATNMAGRGTDIKLTQEVKDIIDKEIPGIDEAHKEGVGGLAIIGTERHDSRRVDRQLRGRSGRQGDPGSSVFYVSFEDPLMRRFASDTAMKMISRMGWEKGEMLEHKMLTNAIEKAQMRVEENNFGIRKRLLEYDDVMNKQRTYTYNLRHHALLGERIGTDIDNMIQSVVENLIVNYDSAADYDELAMEITKTFSCDAPFTAEEFPNMSKEEKMDRLKDAALKVLDARSTQIKSILMPAVRNAVENGETGVRSIPITDGRMIYPILFDLQEALATEGASIVKEWHKKIILVKIDSLWKEHLRELDQLRQSVQYASYEQKDPLVIYKLESFNLFGAMLNNLNDKTVNSLMHGRLYVPAPRPQQMPPQQPAQPQGQPQGQQGDNSQQAQAQAPAQRPQPEITRAMPRRRTAEEYKTSKATLPSEEEAQRRAAAAPRGPQGPQMPIKAGPKIGRNDPCPCGSGKKYKNCHGKGL
ncbi:MAG: preprotein translocase subunit SecA [Bacteroidales bacterium]|nr:preprotein translocase subunit SecA [Bacteroidales bacterium]